MSGAGSPTLNVDGTGLTVAIVAGQWHAEISAGLLAGALSMGAGEYVSVRSQRELLDASTPDPDAHTAVPHLDVDANELAIVYRARGMSEQEALAHARAVVAEYDPAVAAARAAESRALGAATDEHEEIGSAWGVAASSFSFFASGAIIPVIPYLLGLTGLAAVIAAAVLVGIALLVTGTIVGILSGASPWRRALRQRAIGNGAAAATYALGLAFGTTLA